MSSANLNPIRNAEDWHTIEVGQIRSPGACELSGFSRDYGWDIKQGKGTLGATITFNASPPAEGNVKFYLWEESHFEEWAEFRKLFKYDPTKKATTAVYIYHPSLADIDVYNVVCKGIGAIEHDGKGLYSCTVKLLEYLPPPKKSAVSTPGGSKTDNKKKKDNTSGIVPDPIADAQQKKIAELLDEIRKP